jgi:hypothetical protein
VRRLCALAIALVAVLPQAASAAPPIVGGTSFNDAAQLGTGAFDDALDTGRTVFYRVRLAPGQQLKVGASVDVSGLDASLTGTSSLVLRLYDPLRGQDAEAQTLGPGDSATHLKTTSAAIGPVRDGGTYYVSAGLNDFLPQGSTPAQLPLSLNVGVGAATHAPRAAAPTVTTRSGTSWAVLVALCIAGVALGIAGGLVYRRR